MSREGLLRLAGDGLAAYPPFGLGDLSSSCRDLCRALPDVRYCVIADALQSITDWLEWQGDGAAMPNQLVDGLNVLLRRLPLIIEEADQDVALATRLQDELRSLL